MDPIVHPVALRTGLAAPFVRSYEQRLFVVVLDECGRNSIGNVHTAERNSNAANDEIYAGIHPRSGGGWVKALCLVAPWSSAYNHETQSGRRRLGRRRANR